MINLPASECTLPRNIHDDHDFHEDCTALPPALPDSEPTQISFLIAKTKLAFGFARAVAQINRTPPVEWEEVLELDREMRHIYDSLPAYCKLGQLSRQDSMILTSARFTLASIHHKSLCMIHRRSLEMAKSDPRYSYSSGVCLGSAMSILRIQAIQDQEIPADGRLRSLTNYQTSLQIHDYLLAAAIISTELCSEPLEAASPNQQASPGTPSRAGMIKALGISARIFGRMRNQSKDACKGADVLEMLVDKLEVESSKPVQSREDAQHYLSNFNSSSMVTGSAVAGSASEPSHSQTSPLPSSSLGTVEVPPSVSIDPVTSWNAGSSSNQQHPLYMASSDFSWSTRGDGSTRTELEPLSKGTDLECLSLWTETQDVGLGSHFVPSSAEMLPDLAEPFTRPTTEHQSSDDVSFGSICPLSDLTNPLFTYPTLVTNDPLATL